MRATDPLQHLLYFVPDPWPWGKPHEAAGIHHHCHGASVAWPLAARAQQSERMRRIGVLDTLSADDSWAQARHGAFLQGLQQAGWTIGRNVEIETRWAGGDPDRLRTFAAELVGLGPDVIMTTGNAGAAPLLQATRTVPIVFVIVPDPVGAGLVNSLA